MITANLWHLKATNGMFYYASDYISAMSEQIRCILVRPGLHDSTKQRFPDIDVISCSAVGWASAIAKARLRDDLLYTPTSHPVIAYHRQIVVVHDRYPFDPGAPRGGIKRRLFKAGVALSGCTVGYINRSDALPFLRELHVAPGKLLYAPNLPPLAVAVPARAAGARRTVGLFGTDSPKKNYASLFRVVGSDNKDLSFLIYGQDTAYIHSVIAEFPTISIEVVNSESTTLLQFLAMIDVVGSVARGEGFGRPIASALQAGIPCVLIEAPVFREFFDGAAIFSSSIEELAATLLHPARQKEHAEGGLTRLADAAARWQDAVTAIRGRDAHYGSAQC